MSALLRFRWQTLALLLYGTAAGAQSAGESVTIRTPVEGDLYAAGQNVQLRAGVTGDAVAAGQRITISGTVGEDVIAAGEIITIKGDVGDDVRAAGRTVSVWGAVADHATLAGSNIVVQPEARIGGWLWLAGRNVDVSGQIDGDMRVACRKITVTGRIAGDVELIGEKLRIESGAFIGGDLTWRGSRAPTIADDAVIAGNIVQGAPVERLRPQREGIGGWIVGVLALFVAAATVAFTGPSLVRGTSEAVRTSPGVVLLNGGIVLLLLPMLVVVLLATIVGWVLAILLFAAYLLALVLGGLLGVLTLEQLTFGTWATSRGRRLLTILFVTAAVIGLQAVPVLGPVLALLLVLVGLGGLSIQLRAWSAGQRRPRVP